MRLFLNLLFTFDRLKDAENAIHNSRRIRLFGKDLEIEFAQGDRKSIYKQRENDLYNVLIAILFKLLKK